MHISRWVILIVSCILWAAIARALESPQPASPSARLFGEIRGQILDSVTHRAIVGATVALDMTTLGARTDSSGRYVVDQVPPGVFRLLARINLFDKPTVRDSVRVITGGATTADFLLIPSHEDTLSQREFDSGYAVGWSEAGEEITAGRPVLQTSGLAPARSGYRAEHGLPTCNSVGCMISPYDDGRIKAHNECILQFLQTPGSPDLTLKRWENEILDPTEYFRKRSTDKAPHRLSMNGPAVESADGKYCMQIETEELKHFERTIRRPCLSFSGPHGSHRMINPNLASGCEFFWGPEGSDVIFLRWAGKSERIVKEEDATYAVLDLRSGIILRVE